MGRIKYTVDFEAPIGKDLFVTNTGDWRYQRPVTDPERCCKCGHCWVICPVNSRIALDTSYDTDLTYCKGCGLCAKECYVAAISMVEEIKD